MKFNCWLSDAARTLLDALDFERTLGVTHCDPYMVPIGFLEEPYNTPLHEKMRFLRDFGKLYRVAGASLRVEYWKKSLSCSDGYIAPDGYMILFIGAVARVVISLPLVFG